MTNLLTGEFFFGKTLLRTIRHLIGRSISPLCAMSTISITPKINAARCKISRIKNRIFMAFPSGLYAVSSSDSLEHGFQGFLCRHRFWGNVNIDISLSASSLVFQRSFHSPQLFDYFVDKRLWDSRGYLCLIKSFFNTTILIMIF